MSDIICSACTVTVPEPKQVGTAFKKGTKDEVPLAEVTAAWGETGLPPNVLTAFLNAGVSRKELPQYEFRLIKKVFDVQKDKVFDGTDEQASAAGWMQSEFGWTCADCAGTAHETEDSAAGFDSTLTTLLAVQAALPPERRLPEQVLKSELTRRVLDEAESQGLLVDDE